MEIYIFPFLLTLFAGLCTGICLEFFLPANYVTDLSLIAFKTAAGGFGVDVDPACSMQLMIEVTHEGCGDPL